MSSSNKARALAAALVAASDVPAIKQKYDGRFLSTLRPFADDVIEICDADAAGRTDAEGNKLPAVLPVLLDDAEPTTPKQPAEEPRPVARSRRKKKRRAK